MLNLLVKIRINTPGPFMVEAGIVSGNIISTFYNDTTGKYVVYKYDDEDDTTPTTVTTALPGLWNTQSGPGYTLLTPTTPIPYSFCSGTDLQSFNFKQWAFPYVEMISTQNHFKCVDNVVCDLNFDTSTTVVQKATSLTDPDGLIQVSATSSNGNIKYSLKETFNYETEGQTTGRFTNLYPGTYTITAKDENGCTDQITVTVELTEDYGVLYRLDYTDLNDIPTRVDVLERGYSGSIIEVKGGSDVPVILKWDADGTLDKFKSIIPSKLELMLMSESNFQFIDIFSQDERKYKINYYKDWGNMSDGFVPGQQPITLPVLSQWRTEKVSSLWEDWNETTLPYVIFEADSTLTRTELLYVDYKFTAGSAYTLTLNYACVTSIPLTINISVFERSKPRFSSRGSASGSGSGSVVLTFTADDTCDRIGISVNKKLASYVEFEIISVTGTVENEEAEPAPLGYELKWTGYVLSSNYAEPYIKDPYPVKLVASDGLGDLKNIDFTDSNDNLITSEITAFDAIKLILSKTDIGINIISAVNKYEDEMNSTANDEPLTQVTFNSETFIDNGNPKDCATVLSEILKSFGAKILQRDGKWFIYLIEQSVSTIGYREFTSDGAYVGSGTIDDRVDIKQPSESNRVCFVYVSQNMEIIPAYGRFYLEHTLLKNASLIDSHSFEDYDLLPTTNGEPKIKGWTANISNAPGVHTFIKKVPDFDSDSVFALKYPTMLDEEAGFAISRLGTGRVIFSTVPFNIEYEQNDLLQLSFSTAALLTGPVNIPYVKLKWQLRLGNSYYSEVLGWTEDSDLRTNTLIVDKFFDTVSKKITIQMPKVSGTTTQSASFSIHFTNMYTYDYSSPTALKSVDTLNLQLGTKMKVLKDADGIYYYELVNTTDVESLPNLVEPIDYNALSNTVKWQLVETQELDISFFGDIEARLPQEVQYWYLDNVVLLHYPGGETPPTNYTVERLNSRGIKVDLEETYLLNDIDTTNINNSERTYKNFYKRLDGTPTESWTRSYRVGSGKLLDILSEEKLTQYKKPSRKLTGSFAFDREVRPSSVCTETTQGLKKYMFMTYQLNDKYCVITFDMAEIKNYANDDDISADFNTDFSLDFHS